MIALLDVLLTVMGDARLVLPVMAVLAWLWWRQNPRMAWEWIALLVLLAVTVVASKLLYKVFGVDWRTVGFFTVSGHSALSAALYPVLGHALLADAAPRGQRAATLAGIGVAVLIAVSRVLTHRHTPVEIVAGLVVGLAVAGVMLHRWSGRLRVPMRATPLVLGTVMAAMLAIWWLPDVSAERVLSHIAWRIRG